MCLKGVAIAASNASAIKIVVSLNIVIHRSLVRSQALAEFRESRLGMRRRKVASSTKFFRERPVYNNREIITTVNSWYPQLKGLYSAKLVHDRLKRLEADRKSKGEGNVREDYTDCLGDRCMAASCFKGAALKEALQALERDSTSCELSNYNRSGPKLTRRWKIDFGWPIKELKRNRIAEYCSRCALDNVILWHVRTASVDSSVPQEAASAQQWKLAVMAIKTQYLNYASDRRLLSDSAMCWPASCRGESVVQSSPRFDDDLRPGSAAPIWLQQEPSKRLTIGPLLTATERVNCHPFSEDPGTMDGVSSGQHGSLSSYHWWQTSAVVHSGTMKNSLEAPSRWPPNAWLIRLAKAASGGDSGSRSACSVNKDISREMFCDLAMPRTKPCLD